ncbi:PEPxxWA-CTERM sorting domain-containing protein [Erythrobacter sp. QSSC1-22B]|uniref:PEPxxWA-CTERM sorting domain-containing protein n=1 Tax=Erythrobacter sp. QSSC1-22B TaxID=1860125 RepID=UPI0009F1B719|nr:PEPxxWA-CTERM sorting domain-containing protein [Erythrobacter sp. QSSC1-22B]
MQLKTLLTTTAASLAATIAVPANAATLLFELTGGRNVTFELDSNPIPDSFGSSFVGEQAIFRNAQGTVNGLESTISLISFGTSLIADFNVVASGLGFTQFANGGPLFSGPGSAPVFARGTFQLTNPFAPSSNSTLVISEVAAPVPEPGTWAMMLLGFGFVGGAMRSAKRRQKVTVSYA